MERDIEIQIEERFIPSPRGNIFLKIWTPEGSEGAPLVLLHESLGCVAAWRDFPESLAIELNRSVIAYDRVGYGRSQKSQGISAPDFLSDEAKLGVKVVLDALQIDKAILMGHSTGGTMALIASALLPDQCLGVVSESAQSFLEGKTIEGLLKAGEPVNKMKRMEKLRKYHAEKAEWVFEAWIDAWTAPEMKGWSLKSALAGIKCPVLAIHGIEDGFGSVQHVELIQQFVKGPVSKLLLEGCEHVPHRSERSKVIKAIKGFLETRCKS